MSNKVRILYLESDNADADTVAALVGIVREVQNGSGSTATLTFSPTLVDAEPAGGLPEPAAGRAPRKATTSSGSPRQRAAGVTETVVAAVAKAKGAALDFEALATSLYGGSSDKLVKRAKGAVYAAATVGKIKATAPGKYLVVG